MMAFFVPVTFNTNHLVIYVSCYNHATYYLIWSGLENKIDTQASTKGSKHFL